MLDVDIREKCNDLLESVGNEEIARFCYENDMMTKEQALKIVGTEENLKKHRTYCYVLVDIDDVLNEIDDDELYEWLNDGGYDFPKDEKDEKEPQDYNIDKEEWLKAIKNTFSKMFTRVYTKEDFKREICDAIDSYMI